MSDNLPQELLGDKYSGPMALMSTRAASDELLDSALKGDGLPPGLTHGSFSDTTRESKELLRHDSDLGEKEPEAVTEKEPVKAEQEPEPEAPAGDESVPPFFHTLNEQQQSLRERQEAFERQTATEMQRHQALLAQQQTQQVQQQRQPEPEYEYDFTDPTHVRAFQEETNRRVERRIQEAQMPIKHQLIKSHFGAAVERAQKNFEQFEEYFPQPVLEQYITGCLQRVHPDQLAQTNWDVELAGAFKRVDYDRLVEEEKKRAAAPAASNAKKDADKASQKQALRLVPKANTQSAERKPDLTEHMAKYNPRASIQQFGNELKRQIFAG